MRLYMGLVRLLGLAPSFLGKGALIFVAASLGRIGAVEH
jgi:hypothetical protein